ncbi:isoamylase 2, chloroplastic [Phoenix dactylifera]|uniref:Isoamylase 2, chloroplastic n=1 Tax=Phoenix dactylifera TaxID=42345 RepID=A0A8B7CHL6_PHODC|nr:isoamylase 2, chloroplastic [Phoenix dactylifera]
MMASTLSMLMMKPAARVADRGIAELIPSVQKRCRYSGKVPMSLHTSRSSHELIVCAMSQSSVEQLAPDLGVSDSTQELQKPFSYMFRTEIGGLVKVLVGTKSMRYAVRVEVSSLPRAVGEDGLVMNWGIFRSDSSQLLVQDSQVAFVRNSLGGYMVELEFDSARIPFYLSFLVSSPASVSDIRTHRKTKFCVPVGLGPGWPMPLGVSISDDGAVNFSLFSRNAEGVVLCLFDGKTREPSLEMDLDPYVNRTGDIWHVSMESMGNFVSYGYRCKGSGLWDKEDRFHAHHVLLDPYAKVLGDFVPDRGESVSLAKCLGSLGFEHSFDWSGDVHPRLPMEKLVVYRLNVGQFTKNKTSGLPENVSGTFAGLIEKVEHFRTLGVNAVLLEPIFSFDEHKGPYFPYHFFSPMHSYGHASDGVSAINSMKEMVKMLHAHGIEVLLEVAFTQTGVEGDAACQTISFRGIDNSSYYIVDGDLGSGAYNVLKCSNPVVQQLILDSLRHWVVEFHVDGFCFINSSFLARGLNGDYLSRPPLVEAIAFDPILSKTKIIADCWSPLDNSYMEIQFPHWKRWAEMNTRFCSDVRNFLRGEGLLRDLATRLCGSGDLFSSRGPAFSFNYITKNFGLTLVDLVSFSNGDLASELSWNCGEEGSTNNNTVLDIRLKQIRNFLFVLFVSLGVPVLNMGDECGYSTGGSPSYIGRQPIGWNGLQTVFGRQITQFIAFMSSLRMRRGDIFQRRNFLELENIDWHGSSQSRPNWGKPSCKFLAMTLRAEMDDKLSNSDDGDLFISFNASAHPESTVLPEQSEGVVWLRLVDTSLPFPGFFSSDSDPSVHQAAGLSSYELKPHSCVLFEAKRSTH